MKESHATEASSPVPRVIVPVAMGLLASHLERGQTSSINLAVNNAQGWVVIPYII